ncbi:glycoside hydrolase family 51 protein [Hyaloscypha variabilis F]|uniref:non-reducing end alpha-L-arabinofuranosidase n=1 Tax=Hyaloscypha variabilis (strain UAMH 11265 / GT02V1 / F) TaxID=1149755 RepID=A0A2J6RXD5_HYAVF|nr:glycoside hydrolase family 51 protein [Hyaloscypha variabilis F]
MHRLFTLASLSGLLRIAQTLTLNVATSGGNASSPILYGLLFEDVYHSGDGGLYSELIQNRAFQGTVVNTNDGAAVPPFQTLQYWHTSGSDTLNLDNEAPLLTSALPWQMRVDVAEGATGNTGFWNEGYWGMNITTATRYAANFYLRGAYKGDILCAFWSNTTNSMLGSTTFTVDQTEADGWVPYAQTFTTTDSAVDEKNTFHLDFDGASTAGTSLRFQMISVFQQTYQNSNNGLRIDLAQAVNEIGGKYLRMPGGNNLEGLSAPYQWKWNATIGPIIDRPGRPGTWGYVNTDGLGLLEMMQWCLDMGLETILAVWDGEYLNGGILSEADLQFYVDDALNELEFLLGPSTSTYGALRASLGYPDPFTINYVEIGNEDFLNGGIPSYIDYRFNMFYTAIKNAYPDMKIISSIWVGYFSTPPPVGVIQDLHDYLSVDDMVSKFNGYDNSDRSWPVLVGEYAAIYDAEHVSPNQLDNPTLQSATSEAIYFLGLERNADFIVGISHGALIKSLHDEPDNVAMMKHTPNEIVRSYSYYVAKLFATNYGSETVAVTGDQDYGPLYWAATKNDAGTYFVKVVNYDGAAETSVTVVIPGKTNAGTLITVSGPGTYATNVLGDVTSVWTETAVANEAGRYTFTLSGSYICAVLVA